MCKLIGYTPKSAKPAQAEITVSIDSVHGSDITLPGGSLIEADDGITTVRYRIGGGIAGNVAPDTITNVRDIATDTAGRKISVHVTNKDWASDGAEPESIESIKLWAPRFFETQNRCVTQQDYETFATNFNGIYKAKAVVHERSGEANVIRLYVLTYGAENNTVAVPNQTLKDNLLEYMSKYKMLNDTLL